MSIRTATASKPLRYFPGSRPNIDLDFMKSKKLDGRITARRATSGTGIVDGKLVTFPVDTARLTDDGLLVEEERTNIRTHSTAPNASNDYRIYTTASYNTTETLAPDGTNTATKITGNGTINQGFDIYPNNYGQHEGVEQTFSFYVKPVDATSIRVSMVSSHYYELDFTTKTGTAIYGTGGFEELANGWYRVWYTSEKSNKYWTHGGYIDSAAATSNSVYIWGVQLENGSYPTSYISTDGAEVTRAADLVSVEGDDFSSWYNTQGTIVHKSSNLSRNPAGNNLPALAVGNGSAIDDIFLRMQTNKWTAATRSGNTAIPFPGTADNAEVLNVAFNYGNATTAAAAGNGESSTATSGVYDYSNADRLVFNSQTDNGRNIATQSVSRFACYPTSFSDKTLEVLTS